MDKHQAQVAEQAPKADVEPYIKVKVLGRTVATVRIRTPFGTITSARRPS